MKKVLVIYALLLFLFGHTTLYSDGLPGEYILSNKYRATGVESSPLVNPAFVAKKVYPSAQYTGSNVIGEFKFHDLRCTMPVTLYQSVGVTWLYHGTGTYDNIDLNPGNMETKVIGSVVDQNNLFTLSYAINTETPLLLGANLNVIYQRFVEETYTGYGMDVGAAWKFPYSQLVGQHTLGIAMQNALAPNVGATFARTLTFSWHSMPYKEYVLSTVDFQLNDLFASSSEGADGSPSTQWALNTKVGTWLFGFSTVYGLFGYKSSGFDYAGAAVGISLPSFNKGRELKALVQHLFLSKGNSLQSVHLQGEFGWNREEVHQRRMAQRRNRAPGELFEKGKKQYKEEKYWDAYFTFSELQALYPHFDRMAHANLYAAKSLEKLEMRGAARDAYVKAKKKHWKSDLLIDYNLGLMRIYYKESDYKKLEGTFEEIFEIVAPDSIKHHAYYLLGQSHMERKNYLLAQQILGSITPDHPDYLFAQYSIAMSELQQDNVKGMVEKLQQMNTVTPKTKAQQEIQDRANVLIGYTYLDELQLEDGASNIASEALNRIEGESTYYPEALVGRGWLAMRHQDWDGCVQIGNALFEIASEPYFRAEATLITGYGYYRQKEYTKAIEILDEGSEIMELAKAPKNRHHLTVDEVRERYESVAKEVVKLAKSISEDNDINATKLHRRQKETKKLLDETIKSADNRRLENMFEKRLENLQVDIGFVIAAATKEMSTNGFEAQQNEEQKKLEGIESELQKLREKMEKLEE
jgi:hypothetical protein